MCELSILTVTYNSEKFIKDYFESILSSNIDLDRIEILIYDAGSKDSTIDILNKYQENYPNKINYYKGENIGYSKGNNFLAEKSRGNCLFILNPDTKIEKNCLNFLINDGRKFSAILVPQQYKFDNSFLSNGVGMDFLGFPISREPIFYADGAAIFISKELFFNLGMFDPEYFMFFEDVDLSWRAHLMNIPLIQIPKAIVYHYSGGSVLGGATYVTNNFRRFHGEKNLLRNLIKNYSIYNLIWILPLNFFLNLLEAVFFLVIMQPKISLCYGKAYINVIINIRTILGARRLLQKKRIKSDFEIMKKMYLGSSKMFSLCVLGVPRISEKLN